MIGNRDYKKKGADSDINYENRGMQLVERLYEANKVADRWST
jgi:hypothetical protein